MRNITLVGAIAALCGGCAVGQTITYDDATPGLVARAPLALGLVVQDQRSEVVHGEEVPPFVGFFRGGYGNRFDVLTTSGRPLGDDFMHVIGRGLAARGFRVTNLAVAPMAPPAQIVATASRSGTARVLVVQLGDWKSDTYMGTKLEYDVTARVFDVATAQMLGEARVAQSQNLGASFWDAPGHAKKVIPPAYSAVLEHLLNADAIVKALSETPSPPAGPPPAVGARAVGPGSV
jgi:hypothetical protein